MKLTNKEYNLIVDSLKTRYSLSGKAKDGEEIKNIISRLEKEYSRLAKENIDNGMTSKEEEIYPSRLDSEYGGDSVEPS
tara:strand:+ start:242 stop:478 length:237 start_codon:yes stop_codon:yes gene_type:complete